MENCTFALKTRNDLLAGRPFSSLSTERNLLVGGFLLHKPSWIYGGGAPTAPQHPPTFVGPLLG